MKFVAEFIFDSGYSFEKTLDTETNITEHYSFGEEANTSAEDRIKLKVYTQTLVHARMREEFRMAYYQKTKKYLTCTSCFRTVAFNKACGGIANSLHLWGTASDLSIPGLNTALWNWCVSTWKAICKKYGTVGEIGRYNGYIHVGSHIECTPNPYTNTFYIFDKR